MVLDNENDRVVQALNKLILTNKDVEQGYRLAADHVNDMLLKSLFDSYARQRSDFSSELQATVVQMGGDPEDRGSTAGKVRHGWTIIKETIARGDQRALLEDCEKGEDAACEAYEEILEDEDLPFNVVEVVRRHYDEILRTHERIHDLRETA